MAGGFNQTWEVNPYDTLLQPSANQNIANRTLAPLFAGWILNLICFGMVCSSFFTHFGTQHYRRDNPKLRVSPLTFTSKAPFFNAKNAFSIPQLLVWVVVLMAALCASINVAQILHYGVSQQRDYEHLFVNFVQTYDNIPSVILAFIAALTQTFLTHRASKVSASLRSFRIEKDESGALNANDTLYWQLLAHKRIAYQLFRGTMAVLIVVTFFAGLASLLLVGLIGSAIIGFMYLSGTEDKALPFTVNILLGVNMFISAVIDSTITVTLIISLRGMVAGFNSETDGTIRRIMRLSAETGLPTTIVAVLGAFMGVVFPMSQLETVNLVWAFVWPLPSLYAFSLISTLAARKTVSEGGSFPSNSGPNSTSLGGNASRGPKSKNGGRVKDQFAQSIQVHQTTTAAVNVDLELYDLPLEKGSVQHEGGDLPKVQWAS